MRSLARLAWRRCGRRGAFLAFLAVLDVSFGYSLLAVPRIALAGTDTVIPVHAWAWVWIGAGITCATGVPLRRDRVQYAAATALKVAWGGLFTWLWSQGIPAAWVSAAIWLSFAVIVTLVSGWPEAQASPVPITLPEREL